MENPIELEGQAWAIPTPTTDGQPNNFQWVVVEDFWPDFGCNLPLLTIAEVFQTRGWWEMIICPKKWGFTDVSRTFPNWAGVAQFDSTSFSSKGTNQPATTESKEGHGSVAIDTGNCLCSFHCSYWTVQLSITMTYLTLMNVRKNDWASSFCAFKAIRPKHGHSQTVWEARGINISSPLTWVNWS